MSLYPRCHSIREEKRKKEEEEEARKRAEEDRRRREEEDEARRKAEEEERLRIEEEKRKAEEETARKAEESQKQMEEEEQRQAREPQTREDPDIELVTEETLDENVPEEEQGRDEEEDLESCGTEAEAGPQLEEEEGEPATISPPQEDKSTTSTTSPHAQRRRPQPGLINKVPSSRSLEKREQRRRRGLEHSQRESERAASSSSSATNRDQTSPAKSRNQETSKLKERSDSKELDQYTFVAWKMKEDKGGKKEGKASPPAAGPVRPSTLSLQPADSIQNKNGSGEAVGAVNLQRRPGAIKEKPEKWRERKSNGENSEGSGSPPLHSREDHIRKPPQ